MKHIYIYICTLAYIKSIPTISIQFAQEMIAKTSKTRRKIQIHVISIVTNPEVPKDIEFDVCIITLWS